MTTRFDVRALMLAMTVPLLGGCWVEAVDGSDESSPDDALELATAEQALTGIEFLGPLSTPGTFQIGSSTTEMAFLTGVTGNLAATGSSASRVQISYAPAAIHFTLNRCDGCALSSYLSNVTGKKQGKIDGPVKQSGGQSNKTLAPATGNRACYLEEVGNADASHDAFGSSDDRLSVAVSGQEWVLTATGRVMGTATCVNDMIKLVEDSATAGATTVLKSLGPDQPGKVCVLTGIGGKFRQNGASDGVRVYLDSGSWKLSVAPGKYGRAACYL
jgi:hypothetical protein